MCVFTSCSLESRLVGRFPTKSLGATAGFLGATAIGPERKVNKRGKSVLI